MAQNWVRQKQKQRQTFKKREKKKERKSQPGSPSTIYSPFLSLFNPSIGYDNILSLSFSKDALSNLKRKKMLLKRVQGR